MRTCAADGDLLGAWLAAHVGYLNPQFLGEITSGQRSRGLADFLIRTLGNDLAAVLSCSWAEVENAIRREHYVRIVLDYQDCVPQIPEIMQDLDQPMCIPAVEADRGLIKHVERSHQTRAKGGRKLNSLRFAA